MNFTKGQNTPISMSISSDPYMSNYYGTSFPYQAFGMEDGTWSNGCDSMMFLSGYGGQMGHDCYGMGGMFGGGGGDAPPPHHHVQQQHPPGSAFSMGDGTWSNGGDPVTFLSGYGGQMGHDSYGINGMFGGGGSGAPPPHHQMQQHHPTGPHPGGAMVPAPLFSHPVLDELRIKNNYNPSHIDLIAEGARFFVIKSFTEEHVYRSVKYGIWCSTEHGNKRLDRAYRERVAKGGFVYLFFSVNRSRHFYGMAEMVSPVDYHLSSSVWSQDKWKGQFHVRWMYVKDVPNAQLRHIRLENNEPVTHSGDTQEVPFEKGKQVLRVLHMYRHTTSILDGFIYFEMRQEEEDSCKVVSDVVGQPGRPQQQQGQQTNQDLGMVSEEVVEAISNTRNEMGADGVVVEEGAGISYVTPPLS